MARFLQHRLNVARMKRSGFGSCKKWLFSDALAEIGVNPGEVGLILEFLKSSFEEEVLEKLGNGKLIFCLRRRDPYAHVGEAALSFDTEEAAKTFCENYGWNYVIKKRHTPLLKPKSYADNFKWQGPPKH